MDMNQGNKKDDKNMGKGWHGDSRGHAQAGSQSSGNKNPSTEAQRRGGENSHSGGRSQGS